MRAPAVEALEHGAEELGVQARAEHRCKVDLGARGLAGEVAFGRAMARRADLTSLLGRA